MELLVLIRLVSTFFNKEREGGCLVSARAILAVVVGCAAVSAG